MRMKVEGGNLIESDFGRKAPGLPPRQRPGSLTNFLSFPLRIGKIMSTDYPDHNTIRIAVKRATGDAPLHIPGLRALKPLRTEPLAAFYTSAREESDDIVLVQVTHPFFSIYPSDPFHVEHLQRALHQVGRLTHPNILPVLEHGPLSLRPDKSDDRVYVVTERIDGWSIHQVLNAPSCPLLRSVEDVLDVMIQLTQALQYAHEHGVLHTNLNPGNVILTTGEDGRLQLKVLDFALAGAVRVSTGPLEGERELGFLAPEILDGHVPDERSDLYAVGVLVMQVLLTLTRTHGARFERLLGYAERCMHADPEQRFQDTASVLSLLHDMRRQNDGPARLSPSLPIVEPTPTRDAAPKSVRTRSPKRSTGSPLRRSVALPLAAVGAIAAVLAIGFGPQLLQANPNDPATFPLQVATPTPAPTGRPLPPIQTTPKPVLSEAMRASAQPMPERSGLDLSGTAPTAPRAAAPATTASVVSSPEPSKAETPKSGVVRPIARTRPAPRPTTSATPKPAPEPTAATQPTLAPDPQPTPPAEPIASDVPEASSGAVDSPTGATGSSGKPGSAGKPPAQPAPEPEPKPAPQPEPKPAPEPPEPTSGGNGKGASGNGK